LIVVNISNNFNPVLARLDQQGLKMWKSKQAQSWKKYTRVEIRRTWRTRASKLSAHRTYWKSICEKHATGITPEEQEILGNPSLV
jgi:hypothetical protein